MTSPKTGQNLSWGSGPSQNFFDLTPDRVLNAIESQPVLGELRRCTGYVQQLASFENRVYELEFEDRTRAVSKFYRPGRWTEAQIREEHEFMADILAAEVPVVVPHYFEKPGDTLRKSADGLFYCLYPKVGGRQPEDLPREKLQQLGRLIARMHTVGVQKQAHHRIHLTPENYGEASLEFLLGGADGRGEKFVSPQIEGRFEQIVREMIDVSKERFQGQPLQRIHGDCHAGNILWNEKLGPFFIDFDDMVVGPPIQDLWLLAPDPEALQDIIDGYIQMRDLPQGSVAMVECLRALRMVHYATWIAKRYNDPAFKRAFPQFESPKYWEELTYDLEKQMDRILGPVGGARPKDEDEFEGFWDDEE